MVYGKGNLIETEKVIEIIEYTVAGSPWTQISKHVECSRSTIYEYQKKVGLC